MPGYCIIETDNRRSVGDGPNAADDVNADVANWRVFVVVVVVEAPDNDWTCQMAEIEPEKRTSPNRTRSIESQRRK